MKIHALIPARSGSKGIKDKNIRIYRCKPLLAWSIMHGLECNNIDDVFITTNSSDYESIAIKYGAKSLGLRPNNISTNRSRDIKFLQHHIRQIEKRELEMPLGIVLLRPTSPIRNTKEIEIAIETFKKNINKIDSIRSVTISKHIPYKSWVKENSTGLLKPFVGDFKDEYFNTPRQELPVIYWQNGCFDIVSTECIKKGQAIGTKIMPWIQEDFGLDIDHERDIN